MRLNRLTKLAELKKIALEDSAVTDRMALDQDKRKLDSDAAAAAAAKETFDQNKRLVVENDTAFEVTFSQKHFPNPAAFKPGNTISIFADEPLDISWKDAGGNQQTTTVGKIRLNSLYESAPSGEKRVGLSQLSNVFQNKTKQAPTNQPQATRGTAKALVIKHPADTKLADSDYEYEVSDPANQFEWKRKSDGKTGFFERASSGTAKWNQAVTRLNTLSPVSSVAATPAAQNPAATTPTAAEAAKQQQTGRQFNANTIANVIAILQRASKPGGMGIATRSAFKNERGRIDKIINTISTVKPKIGAYDLLAKIIIVTSGAEESFNSYLGKGNYAEQISNADRKDVVANRRGNGRFNKPVAFVLDYMNKFYDEGFSEDNEGTINEFYSDFVSGVAAVPPATPPVAPTVAPTVTPPVAPGTTPVAPTPAPAVVEPANVSASRVDPRIKKLATLRRLRVRGQMEAATESSTRFGRSRVS